MKTQEQKSKTVVIKKDAMRSEYTGKPLNSAKEEAAKKFAATAKDILRRGGVAK